MEANWKKEIFQQKSLWEVYRLSRSVLPKPGINKKIFWITSSVAIALAVGSMVFGAELYTFRQSVEMVRFLAEQGFAFALGILGFLIAGFAIFASVTKVELFIMLANIPYEQGQINRLQFVFFNFLNVFTVYIGLLAVCLLLTVVAHKDSPVAAIEVGCHVWSADIGVVASTVIFGVLGVWIVSAIVKLKSFIWSLYQTVLVSIATEAEEREARDADRRG